ncbi:hypothetical protein HU200_039610 [Digitaria exilis]|uniref:Uncharacterized protein n=1 Tax=Digitaria exilis TaxID=1010633 RepID=A0A835BM49_9POAL|nr:hypothetical protein HU200_039610 [Digitaria exilis]
MAWCCGSLWTPRHRHSCGTFQAYKAPCKRASAPNNGPHRHHFTCASAHLGI